MGKPGATAPELEAAAAAANPHEFIERLPRAILLLVDPELLRDLLPSFDTVGGRP
jgi:ABC-type multidrug transport system fused ATPase/permease subunit